MDRLPFRSSMQSPQGQTGRNPLKFMDNFGSDMARSTSAASAQSASPSGPSVCVAWIEQSHKFLTFEKRI